jgi:AraC-like DNA-binding protein/mannose-6-phosphate isomerase-like protein (cupin superfamily)
MVFHPLVIRKEKEVPSVPNKDYSEIKKRFAEDCPMAFQIQFIDLLEIIWKGSLDPVLHSHDYWQLFYIMEGRTAIQFKDGLYHLKAKDIVLVEPGTIHTVVQKIGSCKAFDVKFAFSAPEDTRPPGMSGVLTDRMGLLPIVENILFEVEHQRKGWRGEVAFALFSMLVRILRTMQEHPTSQEASQVVRFFDPQIEKLALRAKIYIEENYSQNLSCEMIAQQVALSSSYLGQVFQFSTGFSLMEYLTHVRIERAKELLKHGKVPIYIVAQRVGYNSPNYFSRVFKKHEGISPGEYRQLKSS